jgi:branched-chain amino acid transport system substrate-binding protein
VPLTGDGSQARFVMRPDTSGNLRGTYVKRVASSALFLVVAACSSESGTITIGAAGPWTTGYGGNNRKGIDLAVEEINRNGGIDGRPLALVARDDEANGEKATAIAREFVANSDIIAVVGHVNSGTMVSAARVYDGDLAAIATTASSPELSGISDWTFRVIPSDSVSAIDIANFATKMGRRRAAILYENDSYGRGLAASFQRNFSGQIITADPIASGAGDVEPYIAFFERAQPDLVFVAGTDASGIALMRAARARNYAVDFMGADGWTPLVEEPAAEGAWIGAPFSPLDPRPEAQKFVAAYRAKYGTMPDGNAALAYDATYLLARAIAEAGSDRKAIRDWLASMSEPYAGVTGPIRFGPNGDPIGKGVVMTRVRNGSLVVAEAR